MKRKKLIFLSMFMSLSIMLSACGAEADKEKEEVKVETKEDDNKQDSKEETADSQETEGEEDRGEIATSIDDIPQDMIDNYIVVSDKTLEYVVKKEDCICTNPEYEIGRDYYDDWDWHHNFSSHKLVGMMVTPCNLFKYGSAIVFVYELHYDVHGDVTTYVPAYWFTPRTKKSMVDSVTLHISSTCTEVDGLKYRGYSSLDEMISSLQNEWHFDDDVEIIPVN